jgi:hypothetical protein
MLTLLTFGCSFGLTAVTQEGRESVPEITTITPAVGPPNGGTEVTISGSGFAGDVRVSFDGVWGDVTVVDPSTLLVTTPGIGVELAVDVVVEADNGTDTVADGFTYRRGGGDSGEDSGGEIDVDNTGKVGGYVTFAWSDLACPVCTGLPSTEPPTVSATAAFHAPERGSWWSWIPADGACVADAAATALATTTYNAGGNVILNDGTNDVILASATGSGGVAYAASGLTTANWSSNGAWDVAGRGGTEVDAFRLDDVLVTPSDFTYIQPGGIVADTTQGAWTVPFGGAAGTTVSWAPFSVGDLVVVTLTASSGGSTTCTSTDDGTLLVPATAVTGFSNGAQLTIRITRYTFGEAVLPDGSTLETVGSIERVGTGYVSY